MGLLSSLSARRAWIEIVHEVFANFDGFVALRKESVDRNYQANAVDQILPGVALRKESVDRNTNPGSTTLTFPGSLSARRAWIEITTLTRTPTGCAVALRKESVDRNTGCSLLKTKKGGSLSARRAWIEISCAPQCRLRG